MFHGFLFYNLDGNAISTDSYAIRVPNSVLEGERGVEITQPLVQRGETSLRRDGQS